MRILIAIIGTVALLGLGLFGKMWWDCRHRAGICSDGDRVLPDALEHGSGQPDPVFVNGYLSDPTLDRPSPNRISVVLLDADGNIGAATPYAIVVEDGRWAAGTTEEKTGRTRAIFTARPAKFQVLCCDEAYRFAAEQVGSARPDVARLVQKRDGGDLNCVPVARTVNGASGDFFVKCSRW